MVRLIYTENNTIRVLNVEVGTLYVRKDHETDEFL